MNIKERLNSIKDFRYAMHIAEIDESNPAILRKKIIEKKDEALLAKLEDADKQAMELIEKQKSEDQKLKNNLKNIRSLKNKDIDNIGLPEIRSLLKEIVSVL